MLAARKLDVQFKLGDILSSYSVYPVPSIKHWVRDKLWQIDDLLNKQRRDLQLDMLSTLPWMDGEAVFEMKPLSAAFLELAYREQVCLPGPLNGSFTISILMYRMTALQMYRRAAACRAGDKCEGCSLCRCVAVSVHTELMNQPVNFTYHCSIGGT